MTEAEPSEPWEQLYLPKSHTWFLQTMHGVPVEPKTGDREPVMYAINDIVDAGGTLEYAREALRRDIGIAQQEYEVLTAPFDEPIETWAGSSTRAVFYAFYNAVTATRTVKDRFKERLIDEALNQDYNAPLRVQLWKIRNEAAGSVFEDAQNLAGCYLHRFTPPHPGFSSKVVDGEVIYPIVNAIRTTSQRAYPEILRDNFKLGRHASAVIDQYWDSVSNFIDRLVILFYPKKP